jgi:hypothetical protein
LTTTNRKKQNNDNSKETIYTGDNYYTGMAIICILNSLSRIGCVIHKSYVTHCIIHTLELTPKLIHLAFDTAKVRLQLQGQNKEQVRVYKNSIDCMVKIFKNEGVAGLQKGLTPAILREGSKNLFRIGMFDPIIKILHDPRTESGPVPIWKRIVAGSTSGAMGALACNPFEVWVSHIMLNYRTNLY